MNKLPIINPFHIKKIHFIGICGTGMCGIAIILAQTGYYVTGSDIVVKNSAIRFLLELGVKKIFFGHDCSNVLQANVVIISSAIDSNNPELQAAKQLEIPVMKRAVVLAELMRYKYSIVVSGTHGKTTTTSMLTNIYIESGLSPTFINGGVIKSERVQARVGYSHYLIAEADESDKSFLCLNPVVAIITNIDSDHMYTYRYDFKYLMKTFMSFLSNLPIYGYGVVCIDDPAVRQVASGINRNIITYGFSKDADVRILEYHQYIARSSFTILFNKHKKLHCVLSVPGRHNVLNATAAIAVAVKEGVPDSDILKAMYNFKGTNRRLENLGNYSLKNINGKIGSVMLIDDYGHHPTELRATIMTIRMVWPDKRLMMIFQPHRFTRTYDLYYDFVDVLSDVDILLVLDIYAAGEKPILSIDSRSLCSSISKYGKIEPVFAPNKFLLLKNLRVLLKDNDLLLIQGAGTIREFVRVLFMNNY